MLPWKYEAVSNMIIMGYKLLQELIKILEFYQSNIILKASKMPKNTREFKASAIVSFFEYRINSLFLYLDNK